MLNNQDFMEFGWRNNVGSLLVKDQSVTERARRDEDRIINGLKYSYDLCDHDHTDVHVQIVPELHKEEEKPKNDMLVVVPDEHSETGDYHLSSEDYSDSSDSVWFSRNKNEKPKRRRIHISSDEESERFTREVPSVTRKSSKRRRIKENEISNKILTLQQLVPYCHKTDKVSVLDKTIEYMKNLQLQLKVMSIMGMNPYIPPATFDFGTHNHQMLTAMAMVHGQNPANHMMFSPLIPVSNCLLPPFTNQSHFLTTASSSLSPQPLYGLVPSFPSFLGFK